MKSIAIVRPVILEVGSVSNSSPRLRYTMFGKTSNQAAVLTYKDRTIQEVLEKAKISFSCEGPAVANVYEPVATWRGEFHVNVRMSRPYSSSGVFRAVSLGEFNERECWMIVSPYEHKDPDYAKLKFRIDAMPDYGAAGVCYQDSVIRESYERANVVGGVVATIDGGLELFNFMNSRVEELLKHELA